MPITALDLGIVLTGGSTNINPNKSLGGEPSSQPIIGTLNNIFDNISQEDSLIGVTDYRCVYIFNNNATDSFYETKLYISQEKSGGANIEIGVQKSNENQRIIIAGLVTSGSFDISYTPPGLVTETKTVYFDPDPATWAQNIENGINTITSLNCSVTVAGTFSSRIFNIEFSDFRNHDILTIDDSNLVGSSSVSVTKSFPGSPVNSVPVLLDSETTPPNGVVFSYPTLDDPLEIGTIYPEEGFPLWFKRTVEAGTEAIENDGFSIKLIIKPISS